MIQAPKTGASNHALRTQRLRMDRHQTDAAEQAARRSARKRPSPAAPVKLSRREEQCLIWAARGKTFQEVADVLKISFGSARAHLDTARHKLHCMNLTQAVAVAIATGVIPAKGLK